MIVELVVLCVQLLALWKISEEEVVIEFTWQYLIIGVVEFNRDVFCHFKHEKRLYLVHLSNDFSTKKVK